jgi:hypothetical protein
MACTRPEGSGVESGAKPMTTYVHYRVPVIAEVEISTGEVVAVHLADEEIEGPLSVTDAAGQPARPKKRRRAVEIAEAELWPGWSTGW